VARDDRLYDRRNGEDGKRFYGTACRNQPEATDQGEDNTSASTRWHDRRGRRRKLTESRVTVARFRERMLCDIGPRNSRAASTDQ